jgi:hypothetical protein
MLQFVCDSCQAVKSPDEVWILGLAAEAVGFTAARREVNILSSWDYANAVHRLAVHFCSEECKDRYIQALFGNSQPETTGTVTTTTTRKAKRSRRKVA